MWGSEAMVSLRLLGSGSVGSEAVGSEAVGQ
jgi:hypothetical protein